MKALLYKDFQTLLKYKNQMVIFPLVMCVITAFARPYIVFYVMMLIGQWPLSLYSIDNKIKWDQYCLTMPFKPKYIPASKYIVTIAGSAVMCILTTVIQIIVSLFRYGTFISIDDLSVYILSLCLMIILCSVNIPVIIKYGPEKSRYGVAIVNIVVYLALFSFFSVSNSINIILITAVCIVIAIGVLIISLNISSRLMLKKEY